MHMRRDEKKSTSSASPIEGYTYAQLKKLTNENAVLPVADGNFYVHASGAWRFLRSKEFHKRRKEFVDLNCKAHINIPGEFLGAAWRIIFPIFCKYHQYILNAKCLMFDEFLAHSIEKQKKLASGAAYKDYLGDELEYDISKGKIFQTSNPKKIHLQNHNHARRERYSNGASILWYFFAREGEKPNIAMFKKILGEIDACLEAAGLIAGHSSGTDFPIGKLKFSTCRVDHNKDGEYVDFTADKYDNVDNPVLQSLVLPQHLIRQPPMQLPQPYRVQTHLVCDVMAEICKVVNKLSEAFWQREAADDVTLKNLVMHLGYYADKTQEYSMEDRSLYILKTLQTLENYYLRMTKLKSHFSRPIGSSIPILHNAIVNLLDCDLDGLQQMDQLRRRVFPGAGPSQQRKP